MTANEIKSSLARLPDAPADPHGLTQRIRVAEAAMEQAEKNLREAKAELMSSLAEDWTPAELMEAGIGVNDNEMRAALFASTINTGLKSTASKSDSFEDWKREVNFSG